MPEILFKEMFFEIPLYVYILLYLLAVNLIGFILMVVDKQKAKHRHYRIPEKVLLAFAIIGGSIGSLIGMDLVRHKTKRKKFTIGIPIILMVQVAIIITWIVMSK